MSRLTSLMDLSVDLPEVPRPSAEELAKKYARDFVLRRRRGRTMHPDAIHDMLQAKITQRLDRERERSKGRPQIYGWRLLLRTSARELHVRDTRMGATYAEALELRDEVMSTGYYESCWMREKTIMD